MTDPTMPRFNLFNTEAHLLHSEYTDQDFQIGIWIPFSYTSNPQKSYPVLYVPDGEYAFAAAAGLLPTLIGSGEAPEMLIVGIAYHGISTWEEFGILRDRDFCPQDFQSPPHITRWHEYVRFFREELFPMVEENYRTRPDDRAVFGFSSAGFFALNMFLNQPGMFRRHIAACCTWSGADEYFIKCASAFSQSPAVTPVDLYLSVGSLDEEQIPGFTQLKDILQTGAYPNLRIAAEVIEGEGHSAGVIAQSMLKGVRAVFQP